MRISSIFYTITLFLFLSFSTLQAKIKIMPLGDSITWDWHYNDPRNDTQRHGYRNHLWYALQNAGYDIDLVGTRYNGSAITPSFDGHNEGYTGYTTHQIASLVYNKLKETSPDIILLHIGTNDSVSYSPYDMTGLEKILDQIDLYEETYNKNITIILARIIPLPKAGPWVTNFNRSLDSMVENRISDGDNIVKVNMNTITSLIDGIHPTDTGYQQMSTIWFNALTDVLRTTNLPNPLLKPFIERFYNKILLRQGEESGITYWIDALSSSSLAAADLARGFIGSDEFKNQNTDNTEFIEILYHAFFNRDSDSAGLKYWLNQFEKGASRFSVLNGFLYSQEFNILAQSYNILAVSPAELFVTRFYTKVLEREPEEAGLSNWVSKLHTYKTTATDIAKAFFFSDELIIKDISDEKYLKLLYRTLLDREADSAGLKNWRLKLDGGLSRESILDSFIHSTEFKTLAYTYNIKL